MQKWLSGAKVIDLSGHRGNGPFRSFLGVILHVNVDEHGTSDAFFENNPGQVTPNFQVFKDGSVHQFLPFDWQPWCQINGNFNYAAIETAGMPDEPLTAQQIKSIVRILHVYHEQANMVLKVADQPGVKGFGTHQMGGQSWGGHACPGTIRAGQRQHILNLVKGEDDPSPITPPTHGVKLHRAWPSYMPAHDYFGVITGPARSHGGYYSRERPDVRAIQQRLQVLGYAPKQASWADGIFERATANAVAAWQHHYMPGTQFYGQVWSDDWRKLFTY